MTLLIALLAAAPDPLAMANGMNAIPVEPRTLASQDMSVAVSESVRAATWDELAVKPTQPVHVKVACIVVAAFGVPGSCLPASKFARSVNTIDWAKARDDFDKTSSGSDSADLALLRIVTERLQTARAPALSGKKSMFAIRFFEEVVSPSDARAPFKPLQFLTMKDIQLADPIDSGLLGKLYPVAALRNGIAARVSMTCDIQATVKLLCRDLGKIELFPAGEIVDPLIVRDFRFATYQFASTLLLKSTAMNGEPVAGRQLNFTIVWKIPQ